MPGTWYPQPSESAGLWSPFPRFGDVLKTTDSSDVRTRCPSSLGPFSDHGENCASKDWLVFVNVFPPTLSEIILYKIIIVVQKTIRENRRYEIRLETGYYGIILVLFRNLAA